MPTVEITTPKTPADSRAMPPKATLANSPSPAEKPTLTNQPKSANGHSSHGSRLKSPNATSTASPVPSKKTILNVAAGGVSSSSGIMSSVSGSGVSSGRQLWKDQPTIGRYKLTRTLGRGNFAKVKLGEHLLTGQQVAIKVIDKTQLNMSSLSKLVREVKIMKMLNHPNIVRLYEVIESERRVYLVMEYASNGEVFDYLVSNGRMKEKDARIKFRQLVSAVEYCHRKKIVHRDLKAENLLLDKDYNIKLADFGFSNFYEDDRKLDTYCGSPPYAAPELFQGQKYVGPEVDIWSLGVILYTLVSGTLPFDAQHLKELQSRVIRGKYRIPFYMSTECELLLRKLLVLSPSKRKPLKVIMADKWLNLGMDQSPLESYIEPPPDYHDPVRLSAMQKMGYTPDEVREALKNQAFNNLTAIYLLLGNKDCALPNASATEDGLPSSSPPASDADSCGAAATSGDNSSRTSDACSALNEDTPVAPLSKETSAVGNDDQVTKSKEIDSVASNVNSRKPITYSWMKQSASAGPAPRADVTAQIATSPAHVLPRLQLPNRWPVTKSITTDQSSSGDRPEALAGDDSDRLLLFNAGAGTEPADPGLHHQLSVVAGGPGSRLRPSGSDAGSSLPGAHNQPLSRAPPFSDIPHLVTAAPCAAGNIDRSSTLEEQEEPRSDVDTVGYQPTGTPKSGAVRPVKITTKPAVVYRKSNTFLGWLRRMFSCHRQQEPKTSPSEPPDNSPIVRVDSTTHHNIDNNQVVDILNPISRHQFTRNCPDRATVIGLPSHRHQRQAAKPAPPTRTPDGSTTTSEPDTLYGSVTGGDATAAAQPGNSSDDTLNSSIVPRILPADDPAPAREASGHQWSMRLRPGKRKSGNLNSRQQQQGNPSEPAATATLTRANSSGTVTPSAPQRGHFFRRLTKRLYRSLRRNR